MARKESPDQDEPTQIGKPKFLQDPELAPELIPQDARKYMEGSLEILLDIARTQTDPHARFAAIRGIDQLYTTIVMATRTDELLTKNERGQKNMLDEVKRQRRKPWDEGDED